MYQQMKRAFDITIACCGLVVAAPVLAGLAIAIKLTSPGPVLYHGKRVGRHGRTFELLKFRTMVANAEKLGGSATSTNDARITAFGRKLRRYKLDELPQLWNVVTGDMSLVGPRADIEKYAAAYKLEERRIFEIRPGLTDWATVWNSDEGAALAGSNDPEKDYEELIRPIKTELQLFYYDNRSLTTDAKILLYTGIKVFYSSWVPKELVAYGTSQKMGNGCIPLQKASRLS